MKFSSFIKRFSAFALSLILAFSMSAQVFAANYSDLSKDHWAEKYISELSELGYFSGYEDGTFRPNGTLRYIETFALLSRLYKVDDIVLESMTTDYAAVVDEKVPSNLSWAKNELCICLASGIVSASELGRLNLNNNINKKDFALLLVRALQLSGNVSSASALPLPLTDIDDISANYRGSIAILYNAKIVDGDENNCFNPSQTVTRAVASALISRTLSYIDSTGIVLKIPGYETPELIDGVISSVKGSVIRVRQINGVYREYTIENSKYYLNGSLIAPSSAHVGSFISLQLTDDGVQRASVTTEANTEYIFGTVYNTSSTSHGTIGIVRDAETASTRYLLTENASVTLNGKACQVTDFSKNDFVFAKLVNGQAAEIHGTNTQRDISGTISSISFGSTVELRIKDADNNTIYFAFDIARLPKIYIADYEISIDRLAIGDKITVVVTGGSAAKIVSDAVQSSVKGQLTSIIDTVDGLYWEIADSSGVSHKYPVAEDAAVYKGKSSILLSSVKVGNRVSVSLFNSVITSITVEAEETAPQTGKLSGTVLNVNSSSREIIVLISEKLCYIKLPSSTSVYNAATGKLLGLSQITADSAIVAYGSYENSTTLNATLVVVEALA